MKDSLGGGIGKIKSLYLENRDSKTIYKGEFHMF